MTDTTTKLRAMCGHDSWSATDCAHCDAADDIDALRARLATAEKLITECRSALAEELSAWDIEPPLHHVKQAHDHCDAWLIQPPPRAT